MPEREVRDALIVAGGQGTRLRPLTYTVRKELLPFCGAPFLSGVVRRLADAGVERVFLVVGRDRAPFEVLRDDAQRVGVRLETVPEPEPLDTAGGARAVAATLDRAFLFLNGDVLTDLDYASAVDAHVRAGADATIVLTRVVDTSTFGVAVCEGTRIVRFVEKPPPGTLPGHDMVNAGTYVLEPGVLTRHPAGRLSFERTVFPALLDGGGHLEGFAWDGVWADLGTPDRYRQGHRLALAGELDWPSLRAVPEVAPGVRVAASAKVAPGAALAPPVLVLDRASIATGAVVGPYTVVGQDCEVGRGARLAGAVLHERVRIGASVEASGLVAGQDARVEAGAVLGADVVLGSEVVVTAGVRLAERARLPEPEPAGAQAAGR